MLERGNREHARDNAIAPMRGRHRSCPAPDPSSFEITHVLVAFAPVQPGAPTRRLGSTLQ